MNASRQIFCSVFALLCLLLAGCGKVQREEVEIGYRGEARVNPLLAAERFFIEMGLEASRRFSLTEMPGHDVVLMVPKTAIKTQNDAWRVVEWVEEGGHLIYIYGQRHDFLDAWNSPGKQAEIDAEQEAHETHGDDDDPLLSLFDITASDREQATQTVRLVGRKLDVEVPKGPGFHIPSDWVREPGDFRAGNDSDGYSFASFPHLDGRLTLVADAHPWQNRHVGKGDHADFLWEVVTLQPDARAIWLLRNARISFFALLWKYGWMPLLSLLVFVIFWLWRGIPRFGPVLPMPDAAPRQFTSHLAMTGGFFWQHQCLAPLLEPIRRRILRRHQKKSMLVNTPNPDEIIATLAASSGLPPERVSRAMQTETVKNADRLAEMLRDLQTIDLSQ